jgi:hypothetical protein
MNAAIQRYREAAAIHTAIEYGSPASVRRGSRAVAIMRGIAASIARESEDVRNTFYSLMHEGGAISLWVAHHILEIVGGPANVRKAALARIEEESHRTDAQGMGERMWLADYHKRTTEPDAPPNSRAPSPPLMSPEIQTPDSLRTPASGGCG